MIIRDESADDGQAIHAVHRASFATDVEARIVHALRAAGRLTISLVADEQGEVAGHVAFSPVTLDRVVVGLGLGPVAVLPAFRRRGIAELLIREGLAECRRRGFSLVAVVGEPDYYDRFGFEPASRYELCDEFGAGEAFQVLEIQSGTLEPMSGVVHYATEFSSVDGDHG